jgi:hypothetical protein
MMKVTVVGIVGVVAVNDRRVSAAGAVCVIMPFVRLVLAHMAPPEKVNAIRAGLACIGATAREFANELSGEEWSRKMHNLTIVDSAAESWVQACRASSTARFAS